MNNSDRQKREPSHFESPTVLALKGLCRPKINNVHCPKTIERGFESDPLGRKPLCGFRIEQAMFTCHFVMEKIMDNLVTKGK